MPDEPFTEDPPAPPPPAGPDKETVMGWFREFMEQTDPDPEPEPEPEPKGRTARDREAIAEAAARKAVDLIKAKDPAPPKEDDKPPPVEPVKRTRFRQAANRFWGEVDEAVSGK